MIFEAEIAIRKRCKVDPILAVLMSRLANRINVPDFTKENDIRHYAQAIGLPTSRKRVRGIVLFLSEIDVAEFVSDPEKKISGLRWKVNAIELARRVAGRGWKPSDEEIQDFMNGLEEGEVG